MSFCLQFLDPRLQAFQSPAQEDRDGSAAARLLKRLLHTSARIAGLLPKPSPPHVTPLPPTHPEFTRIFSFLQASKNKANFFVGVDVIFEG